MSLLESTSLEKKKPPCLHASRIAQTGQIHPRRNNGALPVTRVPAGMVEPSGLNLVYQCMQQLSQSILRPSSRAMPLGSTRSVTRTCALEPSNSDT